MPTYSEHKKLYWRSGKQLLCIEAWGKNALRVRCTRAMDFTGNDWALLEDVSAANDPKVILSETRASLQNGKLTAVLSDEGWLHFENDKGEVLLREYWRNRNRRSRDCTPLNVDARDLRSTPMQESISLTARFEATDGERIYGMGQYQDRQLDRKGSTLELAHRNSQASVPFYVSSLGYGFLWNNPAIGQATFGMNVMTWEAPSTREMDYWICADDSPADILSLYADATGHSPMMPEYGLGYWQCRLRYRTQAEMLEVVRRHKALGLPMDVIVADFFHWPMQGEFMFDPIDWPDVPGLVKELKSLGIELMVSIWPTVDSRSSNHHAMAEKGYLVTTDRGLSIHMNWMGECTFVDFTHPDAQAFVWERAKENYYKHGIRLFWLDEAEPEYGKYDFDIQRYAIGPGAQVSNIYPALYAKAFYDGMASEGQQNIVNLARCAWAGSQRYGALTWSGDIDSTFKSMRIQLAAGLSMGLSGIPWWNADLGGFSGGDVADPAFHEVLARWFAWGVFTPVMRMHGDRVPYEEPVPEYREGVRQFGSGAPNEVWSFGEEMQDLLSRYILLREDIRPYVRGLMEDAHRTGAPLMRPLFYDFGADANAWNEETAYMFGPDMLVAPVMEAGVTERPVYLPAGETWIEQATGTSYAGGQTVAAYAPLDIIPVFTRASSGITLERLRKQ